MFSQPQQTLWAIDRPFDRRDFAFFEQSSRSRALTKSTLQPVLMAGVQWARANGAINVPTPTFGEIAVTLFDSSDAEPDEESSLMILASVMASTSINGRACIGDALREILRQRSPQSQRVRREASLSAERASRLSLDELFASPMPVRQPLLAMFSTSQSAVRTPLPSGSDELSARMARLEMNTEAMLHRLTAAAPPLAPTPLVDTAPPPQVTVKKSKPVVAVTPAPVPVPAVVRVVTPAPVGPAPESVEESDEDDDDSGFAEDLLVEALALSGPDAGAEHAPSVAESVPEDERSGDKEALSPELFTNLLDHRRWPGMCKLHGRADVMRKFFSYYEEFTHRHKHDAAATLLILRCSAAICEVDLSGPAFKKIRFQVVQQIQTIIARFEFWRIEYEKGTVAASAAEATLLNQAMPKHIQHSRNVSEKVAAKAERAATAPIQPAGAKGAKKPGGKGK